MNRIRNYLFTAISLALLVGAFVLTGSKSGYSENPDRVMVVNSTAEAVPVTLQGTGSVSGSVNIANTPTVGLLSGSAVRIDAASNVVRVDSSMLNPLTIRSADEPASNPFIEQLDITIPDQEFSGSASLVLPAGKEFAIEYISANALAPPGQVVGLIELGLIRMNVAEPGAETAVVAQGPETTPSFSIAPFRKGIINTFELYVANQLTKVYAGGGDTLTITAHRTGDSSGAGAITARVTLSGYCLIRMN
ncbi:MAG TPA: hypothetical protein VNO70_05210 [Blastocatellia bacterium]|nr:hypothetical protein [Blastocatellia bacterium]